MLEQKKTSSIVIAGRLCQYASYGIWAVLALFIIASLSGSVPTPRSASDLARLGYFFAFIMRWVALIMGAGITLGASLWLKFTGIIIANKGHKTSWIGKKPSLIINLILAPIQMAGAVLGLVGMGPFIDPSGGIVGWTGRVLGFLAVILLLTAIWVLCLGFIGMRYDAKTVENN